MTESRQRRYPRCEVHDEFLGQGSVVRRRCQWRPTIGRLELLKSILERDQPLLEAIDQVPMAAHDRIELVDSLVLPGEPGLEVLHLGDKGIWF